MRMPSANALLSALLMVVASSPLLAQRSRRLQSRAAFAALDSTAIADSAAIRPLERSHDPDAALLDMAAFLDSTVGKSFGIRNARVRWWRNFGTQAHPELGILVDGGELQSLRADLVRQKGDAGVPSEIANQRFVHALRFLIAHEYGHLLQYRELARDTVELPQMTRAIECSADLLGAMSIGRYIQATSRSELAAAEAVGTVEHFGYLVGSADWLDMTAHPTSAVRQQCIAVGLRNSALIEFATNDRGRSLDSAGRAFAERVRNEAPAVYARRVSVVQWSLQKAEQLVGLSRSRADALAADLSVTRDTSVSAAVARLVNVALHGPNAMEGLRGPPAPAGDRASVLTESLPIPWKCSLVRVNDVSNALCSYDDHNSADEARRLFDGAVDDIKLGLANVDFQTDTNVRTGVGRIAPVDSLITATRFTASGRGALEAKKSEILVALILPSWKQGMVAQQLPPFRMTVSISPAR